MPQLELFRSPWLLPFAVFTGALLFNSLNLYMVNQWTPTLLPRAGFTIAEAQRQTGLQQGAGLVMGLAMSALIDRWRAGATMIGAFLLAAAAFVAIGLTEPDPTRWRILLVLGAGIVSGAAMALPALTAFLFPPNMVASAVGMGVLIAPHRRLCRAVGRGRDADRRGRSGDIPCGCSAALGDRGGDLLRHPGRAGGEAARHGLKRPAASAFLWRLGPFEEQRVALGVRRFEPRDQLAHQLVELGEVRIGKAR